MQSPLSTGPTLTCATPHVGTTTRPRTESGPLIPNGVLSVPCEHPGCDHKYQSHYDDECDENPCIAETSFGRPPRVSTPPDGLGSLDCSQRRIANLVINAEGNRTEIEIWHETNCWTTGQDIRHPNAGAMRVFPKLALDHQPLACATFRHAHGCVQILE
jgi:hypothetical protein